jgi:hypothetical protein
MAIKIYVERLVRYGKKPVSVLFRELLENMGRPTLKLLQENPRLSLFAPALVYRLQSAYDRAAVPSPQIPAKSR